MKMAMSAAVATMHAPMVTTRRGSFSTQRPAVWHQKASVITQMYQAKRAEESAVAAVAAAEHAAAMHVQEEYARQMHDGALGSESMRQEQQRPLLSVQFPKRAQTLAESVAEAETKLNADKSSNNQQEQVMHFRNRPVSQSAISDAGKPTSRREPQRDRVRYIMSTRLGALPPTKTILDEYPIPKEIVDALEKQRHYHVDESSLMTSFDAMRAGGESDGECYVRRSVPVERKPVSFVLSSLDVAPERPVPPPSDVFHQHVLESATNDDFMLTEVRQLYDHTHESYREFRSTLHRHLDLQYLVDLSFRSSLNSTSYFIDDDEMVASSECSVRIPDRLRRSASGSSSLVLKWRVAKSGTNRIAKRRGAIAVQVVKTDTNATAQRTELLSSLCTFTPQEIQLMDAWYSHDAADASEQPFAPVPMSPALSARFDAVWREVQMPANDRLDLAVKYSSVENSPRLADAVVLWETTAAIIKEREELVGIIRDSRATMATTKKYPAMIAEETAMLQDLAKCTEHLKESVMLTYLEVGDFVSGANRGNRSNALEAPKLIPQVSFVLFGSPGDIRRELLSCSNGT